ncbi:MAG: hypothetical protein HeimAB125_10060, partial [Candidatus Heimdallarchaeota archaeon AB_125]
SGLSEISSTAFSVTSFITVNIVPSVGLSTDSYANSVPSFRAVVKVEGVTLSTVSR